MVDQDPEEIFKDMDLKSLELLADKCNLHVPTEKKSKEVDKRKLIEMLIENVTKEGTSRVLGVLKIKTLHLLVDHPDVHLDEKWRELSPRRFKTEHSPSRKPKKGKEKEEAKKYPSKGVMLRILEEFMKDKPLKNFLDIYSQKVLLACCESIDDLSNYSQSEKDNLHKKDLIKAILNNVNSFGMHHLFQNLTVVELGKICEDMGLVVESSSMDILIESIMEKKDHKRSKTKGHSQKPSSKKPTIDQGITKVDLNQWYTKDELEKWIKEKKRRRRKFQRSKINWQEKSISRSNIKNSKWRRNRNKKKKEER